MSCMNVSVKSEVNILSYITLQIVWTSISISRKYILVKNLQLCIKYLWLLYVIWFDRNFLAT